MVISISQIERHAREAAESRGPVPAYLHPAGEDADRVWLRAYLSRRAEITREHAMKHLTNPINVREKEVV